MAALLEVRDLRIGFPTADGPVSVVEDVSFSVERGELVGVVGESGSGKSMTMAACMQLIPTPGRVLEGSILLDAVELVGLPEQEMRRLRGKTVSMVLQDAMTALHPTITIGRQLANVIRDHSPATRREIRRRSIEALEMVGVPRADERLALYPHQLSGGLRQRVMIAMAIVNRPDLLIADEPTTALDVTLQAQIVELLRRLSTDFGMSVVIVTHNFGVVAGLTDRTIVMKEGRVIENGPTAQILTTSREQYTQRLLAAVPRVDEPRVDAAHDRGEPAVVCEDVVCDLTPAGAFSSRRAAFRAVDHVSLTAYRGRTLGLVGESGAGKTTLARSILRLTDVTSGRILVDGEDFALLSDEELRRRRPNIQMVFQDPYTSLDPRMTVEQIIAEPLKESETKDVIGTRVGELLEMVELSDQLRSRYPVQMSGGQRQRVAIARALASRPDILVADEPVSALDVTIQLQLVTLFSRLQRDLGLTLIIVAHDLGLVRAMCDQVAVLRDGRLVEYGDSEQVFQQPREEYTRQLIAAARSLSVPAQVETIGGPR